MGIHPTALVDPDARLGEVEIGPYAVVEGGVTLHDGVVLGPHSVVHRGTTIGGETRVSAHVVLGGEGQDRKHVRSVETHLIIGSRNVFREFSTAHRGSSADTGVTVIGDDNYFMANSHVAHDCVIGNQVMFANSAAVGGHVEVHDGAILGGLSAVHQHARIGRLAMVGGGAMCAQDVPPFTMAQGDRARLYGLNIIGLRRHGVDNDTIAQLKEAWRTLFAADLPRRNAISRVAETMGSVVEVAELLAFLRSSPRGICRVGVA